MEKLTYKDLHIHQKIMIRGWIETEGKGLPKGLELDFRLLKMIQILSNYKEAIGHFLNKMQSDCTMVQNKLNLKIN